jgi:hypothetical protein
MKVETDEEMPLVPESSMDRGFTHFSQDEIAR